MPLSTLLSTWRADPDMASNIAAWRTIPARPAQFIPFPDDLHPALMDALRARGICALYTHQAAAWQLHTSRPALCRCHRHGQWQNALLQPPRPQPSAPWPHVRALYLFPTKALAQDRQDTLRQLLVALEDKLALSNPPSEIPISTYDGDTPTEARPAIRAKARLVISNPDMLHAAVLPHHTVGFFARSLDYVVRHIVGAAGKNPEFQ